MALVSDSSMVQASGVHGDGCEFILRSMIRVEGLLCFTPTSNFFDDND